MRGDIPVEDPTCADLEDEEDIEEAEADRHGREEVTGYDRVRMIPHKRRPPLGPPTTPGPQHSETPSDRAGCQGDAQFQAPFVGDPFLNRGRIGLRHGDDQSLHRHRNRRPSWSRLPAPVRSSEKRQRHHRPEGIIAGRNINTRTNKPCADIPSDACFGTRNDLRTSHSISYIAPRRSTG